MRGRVLRWALLLGFAWPARAAVAQDAPPDAPSAVEAASQVREAVKAGDPEALAALASRPDPDPWLVAHVIATEDPAAAAVFARAVPAPAGPRLARYLSDRKGVPEDRTAYAALLRVEDAMGGGHPEEALRILEATPVTARSILAVRANAFRARALDALRRPEPAALAWEAAADAAAAIGWAAQEVDGLVAGGISAYAAWRLQDMRRLYERLARVQQDAGDVRGAAMTIADLGSVAEVVGDHGTARLRFETALRLMYAVDDPLLVAGTRARLGAVCTALGDAVEAYAHLHAAIQVLEARPDGIEDLVDARTFLGNLYEGLGLVPAAAEQHRMALVLAARSEDRVAHGVALGNLARVLLFAGKTEEAQRHLEVAAQDFEAGGDRLNGVRVEEARAELARMAGRFDDAAALDGAAIAAARELGAWVEVVEGLEGLARTRRLQGRPKEALAIYEEALAEAERFQASDCTVPLWSGVALCQEALGDPEAAVRAARTLVTLARTVRTERADPQYRARRREGFSAGARCAAKRGDVAALWTFLEAGRAQALLDTLGGRSAMVGAAVAPKVLAEEAEALAAERAALHRFRDAVASGDATVLAERRREVARARERVDAAVEQVQAQERIAALGLGAGGRTKSADEMRRRLGPQDAFVLYGLVDPEALAIVVTPDAMRLVSLGPAARIRERLQAYRPDEAGGGTGEDLAALQRLLVKPLELTARQTRVTVAPDGPLAYAPLGGLFGARDVSFVPSGAVYDLLLEDRARRGERRLALGDPDYGGLADQPAVALLRGGAARLSRLPATAAEARSVVRTRQDVLLTDRTATEGALRDALAGDTPRWQVVHLACHGLIDPASPRLSALALTPKGDDDGLLMAREILRMRIASDLVVLSACETARDQVAEGEGLLGLAPAFLMAGSPRVVAGLWKVDDEATKALMDAFYASWDQGTSAAGSLRAAQAAVRAVPKWSHPRFWAPWVVWGLPD